MEACFVKAGNITILYIIIVNIFSKFCYDTVHAHIHIQLTRSACLDKVIYLSIYLTGMLIALMLSTHYITLKSDPISCPPRVTLLTVSPYLPCDHNQCLHSRS